MRYDIFTRGDDHSIGIGKKLESRLAQVGDFVHDNHPDIVITIGGDGTFLRAVQAHMARLDEVIFVGIHTGTLGFFCDYHESELDLLVTDMPTFSNKANHYRLVQLKRHNHHDYDVHYAVNEIRLENPFHTLVSNVLIDGILLETFRGNGLIVSSTLGSSGYNKSLGGALINTKIETLQLSEVATLQNNAYRSLGSSLVLNEGETITFTGDFKNAVIGFDHVVLDQSGDVTRLDISLSDKRLAIVHQTRRPYIEILRKSFIKD